MGRMLGSFDPEDELDRPDLNKCPDCGCYFATDTCPLCGKPCPPEMRAGARVEPKKKRRKGRSSSGRVQFVPWYHSWWFILIMMFWMPPAGIVLLITSPYRTRWKVLFCSLGVVFFVIEYLGVGSRLLEHLLDKPYVNSKLSETEYKEKCEAVTPEQYYRSGADEGYFTMSLTVKQVVVGTTDDMYDSAVYYLCQEPGNPSIEILVMDCRVQGGGRLLAGDTITVWGQANGSSWLDVYDSLSERYIHAPGLYAAYVLAGTAPSATGAAAPYTALVTPCA